MRRSLILVKEARVDSHVLLYPLTYFNAETKLLEQVAQSTEVDQLNWRGAITSGFCLALIQDGRIRQCTGIAGGRDGS